MKRRDFVKMGVLSVPSVALAQSMQEQPKAQTVAAGADRLGETHTLGFSKIAFKVSPANTDGGLFIMEHSNLTKGGPYRHVHPAQDEWLYAMEGEFRVEIGDQKLTLKPGDSVLNATKSSPRMGAGRRETRKASDRLYTSGPNGGVLP